tara:strand:+ start:1932 stop:2420 length:489 start_codon:yes stop_codon:yes gene_type:complete
MSNKWTRPAQPPSPLFVGEKEKNLVKQVNDEIIERVVGQQVLYFAIDMETTNFHPLYGEAIEKNFLHPIRVFALVEYGGIETNFMDSVGIDKKTTITVHFHKRRLTEDQNLFVREGDFVRYGDIYYEITKLNEPKQLFGQIETKYEITADCIRARDGLFNGE